MSKQRKGMLIAAVLVFSIVLAYVFAIRPWHMHWGATADKVRMTLPGDRFIAADADTSTRAITIHAPAAIVWQWLVQIGQDRGGFNSYHWLENLFAADMHNGDQIIPEWQEVPVGRKLLLAHYGSYIEASAIPVVHW